MMRRLRSEVARRVFRGRVRLGDGSSLSRIGPQELEEIRRRFPLPKFFLLGHARSGTSFLGRLLRLHPEVHCEWQTQFFSERGPIPYFTSPAFQHWLSHPSNRWVSGWDATAALLRVCLDTILEREARRVGKRIVGDKSPNENGAEAIRWLSAVYPDGRLIYILRDGRDTILSKRIQSFIDQPDSLSRGDRRVRRAFIEDPRPFLERERSIFTPEWLSAAARGWAEAVRQCVSAGRERFEAAFEVVRYEDLLADPYPPLLRLWGFLGAGPATPQLEAAVREQTSANPEAEWHESSAYSFVSALPRGVHGGWRSLFTQSDTELFNREAHQALAAFDYLEDS